MDRKDIKQANRKALPKFILALFVAMCVGGGVGYLSGRFRANTLTDEIRNAGAFFGAYIAPWLLVGLALVLPAVCIPLYRGAKRLSAAWDGEDEDISGRIDRKISLTVWISGVSLILSYFLIAASYSGGFSIFESGERTVLFTVGIAAFLTVMIEVILLQQKCVDTVKETNPEKKASVYDMKFHVKWLEDCDEAEKIMIGKCAYKAYSATNAVCTILAILLAVCALVFGIGFLPSLAVSLIWIVNLTVYCKEAMRYSKAGNKIS